MLENHQIWGQQPSSSFTNAQHPPPVPSLPPKHILHDVEPMNEDYSISECQSQLLDKTQERKKHQLQNSHQHFHVPRFGHPVVPAGQQQANLLRFPQPPITSIKNNCHAFLPQEVSQISIQY